MDFKTSETKTNLMRAFAGESQASNRYTFAASQTKKEGLQLIENVFLYTAGQEKEHAEIFYNYLRTMAGETIIIDNAGYPIDLADSTLQLLRMAQHNEYQEHDVEYKRFGDKAKEEGFAEIAASFHMIAEIEKIHGDRFGRFADFLEQNKLFVFDMETGWICLNCGHVYTGKEAPAQCPVCHHDRGYFIRLELSPYEK